GCAHKDTVIVTASIIKNSLSLTGSAMYCSDSGDSSLLHAEPSDSVQWYRDNAVISGANHPDFRVTRSGDYYAMLFNQEGCSIATATQKIIIDDPKPGITYPLQYAVLDLPLELEARNFGDTVLWNPPTWLNTPTSYTPIFDGLSDQLYTIEIKTVSGCVTVDTQFVKTVRQVEILVPTAFTPNNDGLNDILRPTLMGVKELRFFRIFNRWGQMIFDTKTEHTGWDGTVKGSPMPSQVVVWMMEGVGVDNTIYRRKGTSVLVR